MSKIKRITVSNLQACRNQTGMFDGATVIVTGKNNGGKTSFLRGLFNRLRGLKADDVITHGETEGFAEYELTTGERLKWEFSDKPEKGFKEKLTYISEKDIKSPLTAELRKKFAPDTFDVDEFLATTPQKQRKALQDLAGLDFTDIDARYDVAYKERTAANTRIGDAKSLLENTPMPEKVETVDLVPLQQEKEKVRGELNELYKINKGRNDEARMVWQQACEAERTSIGVFNSTQYARQNIIDVESGAIEKIENIIAIHPWIASDINMGHINDYIKNLDKPEPVKQYVQPAEPIYIIELPDNAPLLAIEAKIEMANSDNVKATAYNNWITLQTKKNEAATNATAANDKVVKIEQERMDIIKTAKMPEGFTFTDDGIAYNGLAFTRQQLSSSGIYIAALKLASMKMGEIRTLHFDASFLDNNSLAEIEAWANSQDLQLLIELPDRAAGEITYEIVSNI